MNIPSEIWHSKTKGGAVSKINTQLGQVEVWVVNNSSWVALGIVAAAFIIRLFYSGSCYLNPDEAAHFGKARVLSWGDAYKASRELVHPPLFILVLHGILFLGRTEIILRTPSLVGGTVALWFTFAWLRRIFGGIPALAGLGFLAVSPAAISASTEVRQYGLLLCFVCGCLYATERTITERSTFWAIVQGLFLLAALLTHYTAVVVLPCVALYALLRALLDGTPRRIIVIIGLFQLFLATVLGWLYFHHIRPSILRGPSESLDYLRPYYYAAARETPLGYAWRALSGTFLYAVGTRRLSFLFMLVFLAGLAAVLTRRAKVPRVIALLIISPFVVGFTAAVLHVFPFAGSRHQTYLLPFLAAGISAGLLWLQRAQAISLLLLGTLLVPLWAARTAPDNSRRILPKGGMTAAIEYIRRMIPPGTPVFVDYETRHVLRYYLARNDPRLDTLLPNSEVEESLGGYRVVIPKEYVWAFRPNDVLEQVNESAGALGVAPGSPLWIITTAWLDPSLASRLPMGGDLDAEEFGRISVIKALRWGQGPITINWSDTRQTIDGFGAATGDANPPLSPALMDSFYTDSGIHLKFIRVAIWAEEADCDPGDCVDSPGATITKADLANAQAAVARGALVWATEWSPPRLMKSTSRINGGSLLGSPTNFVRLANIQTSFVRLVTGTYGIPIYALSPQNEPDVSTTYPSCIWTGQQLHDYVPYLARALRDAGYGSVKIMIAEQGTWSSDLGNAVMGDSAVAAEIGILASHGYGGCCSPLSWSNLTTQRLWESEVSDFGTYDGSITSGLTYAREIHTALTLANVNSWHYWSLSGMQFTDNEGLTDSSGNIAKRAYTFGNFSKFILPGWTRVGVTNNTGLLVSAFKGPNGGAVVVVVNSNSSATNQAFSVGTAMGKSVVPWITSTELSLQAQTTVRVSSGSFTYNIPSKSVVSFVSPTPASVTGEDTGSHQSHQ
ncbi:MAG: glycosyltransferase family 39 protein [Terriglobales bacterium]